MASSKPKQPPPGLSGLWHSLSDFDYFYNFSLRAKNSPTQAFFPHTVDQNVSFDWPSFALNLRYKSTNCIYIYNKHQFFIRL